LQRVGDVRSADRDHDVGIGDQPSRDRGKKPHIHGVLPGQCVRRSQRHNSLGQRDHVGPRKIDRNKHFDRLGARGVHQSDVRYLQRRGGSERCGRVDHARSSQRQCLRGRDRCEHCFVFGSRDDQRRHRDLRRRPRKRRVRRGLRQVDRRGHSLATRRNRVLATARLAGTDHRYLRATARRR